MAGNRNSGRHRKPAIIRKAEGNRSRRPIPAEPQGRGQPALPLHLSADERAIFMHVMNTAPAGLITAADQHIVEAYAVAVALFRDADRIVKKDGFTSFDQKGRPCPNPFIRIRRQAATEIRALADSIGLSPLARTRLIGRPDAEPFDPIELFIGGEGENPFWVRTQ